MSLHRHLWVGLQPDCFSFFRHTRTVGLKPDPRGAIGVLPRLASVVVVLALGLLSSHAHAASILPGSGKAVEFSWQEANGGEGTVASLRGQPVVLHFWAAWCSSCGEELPGMADWSRQQQGAKVIFVSLDQKMAQARWFIDKHRLPIAPRLAEMAALARLGLRGLPVTLLLDGEGRETGRILGVADWQDREFLAVVAGRLHSGAH